MAGPTLRDVARLAGVSAMTVSRVVNGTGGVTPERSARVHQAIRTLGYRTNPIARSLRTGQDQAVGLVVESIADPFFAAVTDAVEQAARAVGLFLIIASAGVSAEEEHAVVRGFLRRSVSGLLITPCRSSYGPGDLQVGPDGVPAVFLDRPPRRLEADVVMTDHLAAADEATFHLIAHGHRRIAFVGTDIRSYALRHRLRGYRRALARAGIEFDPTLVVNHRRSSPDGASILGVPLGAPEPVTAVMSANAVASIAVMREVHWAHREDLAIVSFDDFPVADSLTPAITAVQQNPAEIGKRAFALLLRRMEGDTDPFEQVLVPTTFILRGSGELPPPTPAPELDAGRGRRRPATGPQAATRAAVAGPPRRASR
jgi:LacI family transcriptional regulator